MAGKRSKEEIDEFDDDEIIGGADEITIKAEEERDMKVNTMMASLRGVNDFTIKIYRKGANGKREWLYDYHSELPSEEDLRNRFGGGQYILYAKDPNTSKLINSATLNIADLPRNVVDAPVRNEDDNEERFLKKMMTYRTIFGTDSKNDSSETLAQMMMQMQQMTAQMIGAMQSSQQDMNKQLLTLMSEMKTGTLQSQLDSERRFAEIVKEFGSKNDTKEIIELMSKTQAKQSGGFAEMMQMLEFMRMVKEEVNPAPAEEGMLGKYLPQVLQMVPQFMGDNSANTTPPAAPALPYNPPAAVKPMKQIPPEYNLMSYPEPFRTSLSLETKEEKKKMLIEKLGKTPEEAEKIITILLKQKGVAA